MSLEIYNQNSNLEVYRRIPQDIFSGDNIQQAFQLYYVTPDILARVFVDESQSQAEVDFYTYSFENWYYYYLEGFYYYQYSLPYTYFIYYDIFYYVYEYYYIFYGFFNQYSDFYSMFYYLFWGYPSGDLLNSTSFLWFNSPPGLGTNNIHVQSDKGFIFPNPLQVPVGTQETDRMNAFLGETVDVPYYIGLTQLGEQFTEVVLTPAEQFGETSINIVKLSLTKAGLDTAIAGAPLSIGDITSPVLLEFWVRITIPYGYLPIQIPFLNIYDLGFMLSGISGSGEIPWVAYIAGGYNGSYSVLDVIEYFDADVISGNTLDRGDLTQGRYGLSGCQGSAYGFYCCGESDQYGGALDTIDYIDLSSLTGNAVDRGNMQNDYFGALTSSFWGENYGFFSVNSTQDVESFDLTVLTGNTVIRDQWTTSHTGSQGMSGSQYSVVGPGSDTDTMERFDNTSESISISSRGSWLAFYEYGCVSATERDIGIILGGKEYGPYGDTIVSDIRELDLTVSSGSPSDRGNLTEAKSQLCGVRGSTYGFACGGENDSYMIVNVIEYFDHTVSNGSATDRGDLAEEKFRTGGCYSGS